MPRYALRLLPLILLSIGLGACGPEPPSIRDLKYSPNAALVGMQTTISGTVAYTDNNNDISQSVVELYAPNGALISMTPPTPIMNVGMGVVGMVNFDITMWTPDTAGIHHFQIYIIDLTGAPSNKLQGVIRVN